MAGHIPIKAVKEVFGSSKNKSRFCMPLGVESARSLELNLEKEKAHKQEIQTRKQTMQKPVLSSKQIH